MHCHEQTIFTEEQVGYREYLKKFRNMKSNLKELRNTADVAALFVTKSEDCNKTLCGASYFGKKTNK